MGTIGAARAVAEGESRLLAVVAVARFNGVDLSPADFRATPNEPVPSPAMAGPRRTRMRFGIENPARLPTLSSLKVSCNH